MSDSPAEALVSRRRRLIALLLTVPAIATGGWIIALDVWRARDPQSPLFVTPFVYSLAEAIERDDVQRGYEFLRDGQDPNSPIVVRHPTLTRDRDAFVTPVVWAVMSNSPQSLLMLLGHGARLDGDAGRRAMCLARTLDRQEIAEIVSRYAAEATGPCQDGTD